MYAFYNLSKIVKYQIISQYNKTYREECYHINKEYNIYISTFIKYYNGKDGNNTKTKKK